MLPAQRTILKVFGVIGGALIVIAVLAATIATPSRPAMPTAAGSAGLQALPQATPPSVARPLTQPIAKASKSSGIEKLTDLYKGMRQCLGRLHDVYLRDPDIPENHPVVVAHRRELNAFIQNFTGTAKALGEAGDEKTWSALRDFRSEIPNRDPTLPVEIIPAVDSAVQRLEARLGKTASRVRP